MCDIKLTHDPFSPEIKHKFTKVLSQLLEKLYTYIFDDVFA